MPKEMPVPGHPGIMSYQLQNGEKRYCFRIRTGRGEQKVKRSGFITVERASRMRRDLLHRKDEGRLRESLRGETITFGQYAFDVYLPWVEQHRKASTARCYEICLVNLARHWRDRKLAEITMEDVHRFISFRKTEKVKDTTINRDLAVLRAAFRKAHRKWGYLSRNQLEGIELFPEKRRERTLSEAELRRLLDRAPHPGMTEEEIKELKWDNPGSRTPPDLRTFIALGAWTGMRRQEILDLRWEDVDLETGYAKVHHGKSEAARRLVPLDRNARALLGQLEHRDGPVIRGPRGGKLTWSGYVQQWWNKACAAAKVDNASPHCLRHTFATAALEKGVDLWQLAQLLGHSSTAMAQKYAHVRRRHLDQVKELLDRAALRAV